MGTRAAAVPRCESFFFVPIPACAVGPDNAVVRHAAEWSLFYFMDLEKFAHWHRSAQGVM